MARRQSFWLGELSRLFEAICMLLAMTGVISIMVTLIVGGPPALRVMGYEIASRQGRVSRRRALWRAMVAWSPVLIATGLNIVLEQRLDNPSVSLVVAALAVTTMIAVALWSIWRPRRALHERLTGTWVVPS
jgi:hypothetical protein